MILAAPIIDGMWRQYELYDGTYGFVDLLDAIEILQVKSINQMRQYSAIEGSDK